MKLLHTFAICAYKESEYLEECIKSVLNQTVKSEIIITTSTPNDYIKNLSIKYNLPLFINEGISGIGGDFNFAKQSATTKYVTIAHQDDLYFNEYAKKMIYSLEKNPNSIIAFCNYSEARNGNLIDNNTLLKIKRLMNAPIKLFPNSKFVRNRVLSLGCSICCPSVTFNNDKCKNFAFDLNFKCNLDWDAWSRLARIDGRFIYIKESLMAHRVHEGSETTALLDNGARFNEDIIIFNRYYPKFISKIIERFYKKSANSNNLK